MQEIHMVEAILVVQCFLIELSSLDSLIQYFKSIHNNDLFELKGVHVNNLEGSTVPAIEIIIQRTAQILTSVVL